MWEDKFYLRVTAHSAVDTLTPARSGVESHHSVDRVSWSGQISAHICLREEPTLWTVQVIVNYVTSESFKNGLNLQSAYKNIHTSNERIQSSGTPVRNTNQQEDKGDQRVQQSRHHVTDCPERIRTHTWWGYVKPLLEVLNKIK